MTILLIIAICIVAILLVIMATIRVRLKKQSERLSEKVSRISSYENIITNNDKRLDYRHAHTQDEHPTSQCRLYGSLA